MNKNVVAIVAIIALAIIVGLSLHAGIDGNVVIASISVLGGLGGYVARQVNHTPKA
jgi:hypothetical protein